MDISDLAIRLLLLFFPGVICAYLIDEFTVHRPRESTVFLLQAFALGIGSYFLFWICLPIHNYLSCKLALWDSRQQVVFLRALIDPSVRISFSEIAWVSVYSGLLASLLTAVHTYKLHFKLAKLLRLSKKFGELDVWGYTFNMKQVEWATVRNYDKDLMYDGWVQSFSDDAREAEILLRDVSVYRNSTGVQLYQVGMLYLSMDRNNIEIEFRGIPITEFGKCKQPEQPKEETDEQRAEPTETTSHY